MKKTGIFCIVIGLMLFMSLPLFSQINNEIRIMCLGDSITQDNYEKKSGGGPAVNQRKAYRKALWDLLKGTPGFENVDFVGRQKSDGKSIPNFDRDHEGYAGIPINQLAKKTYSALVAGNPDIILLHIGTNTKSDSKWGQKNDQLEDLLSEIDRWETNNHPVWVLCATLVYNKQYPKETKKFNDDLSKIIYKRIQKGDEYILVPMDMVITEQYLKKNDRFHPSTEGYIKMAETWHHYLEEDLFRVKFDNECSDCKFSPLFVGDEGGEVRFPHPNDPGFPCKSCSGEPYYCSSQGGCFKPGESTFIWGGATITVEWW